MYDINRIESLDGPQGTLFGGTSQSGTLRVLTNQPDPSQFEAAIDVTLRQGPKSGLSNDINAMVNLPFGEGKGALRLTDERAQYSEASGFFELPFSNAQDGRDGISRIYTNRPWEFGIRIAKRWSN